MPFPTDWNLEPLVGAGTVRIGMSFEQIVALLGGPDQPLSKVWGSQAQRAAWANGGLAIHFSPGVEFIEFSRDSGVCPHVEGIAVFDVPANEVVERLAGAGHSFDTDDPEVGYTYIYKGIQVGLWRHAVPEGHDDDDGKYFDTVGLGMAGYYS